MTASSVLPPPVAESVLPLPVGEIAPAPGIPPPFAVAPGVLAPGRAPVMIPVARALGTMGQTLPRLAPARVRRLMPEAGPGRQMPEMKPGRQMPEAGARREVPEVRSGRQMPEEGPRRRVPELPDRPWIAEAEHGLRAQLPRAPMMMPDDLGRGVDEDPDGWRRPQVAGTVVACGGRPGKDPEAAEARQEQAHLVHCRCLLDGWSRLRVDRATSDLNHA
jgi:hypothetical protein